jgi:hypothetical protein
LKGIEQVARARHVSHLRHHATLTKHCQQFFFFACLYLRIFLTFYDALSNTKLNVFI